MNHIARKSGLAAMALTMSLGLAACGGDEEASTGSDTSASESTSEEPVEEETEEPAEEETEEPAADAGAETFGAGCSAIPADGAASFNGMATEPVATAASANPLLETLVAAVTEAGLVDTLNSAEAITVFAPTNDAFAKIPADAMKGVMADKELLTKILTNHVVEGQLDPESVVGKQKSLAGGTLNVKGSGEEFTVTSKGTKMSAVLCGNVPTANATVYIVDTVLMP
ncbi:fasciclin domain-containing protein [Nocardioides sp.]|uniref:fasciclin domain-containing protein n=1 Tax=Nocardioides sp. TaxID=35761 RepID=UPI002D1BEA24|nr:fasciclin domain-containing protein [Nocardioides sp.]HXH79086.1 fasciclin domain-containing protein [Nocardioides sp.]